MHNRYRSPVALATVASLILLILKNYNLLPALNMTDEVFNKMTDLIFAVLVSFGIFNDPTSRDKY